MGKYSLQIYEGGGKKKRDGVFQGGKGWVDIPNAYNVQSSNKMQWCSLEYLARTARYFSRTDKYFINMENPGALGKHCKLRPKC